MQLPEGPGAIETGGVGIDPLVRSLSRLARRSSTLGGQAACATWATAKAACATWATAKAPTGLGYRYGRRRRGWRGSLVRRTS